MRHDGRAIGGSSGQEENEKSVVCGVCRCECIGTGPDEKSNVYRDKRECE